MAMFLSVSLADYVNFKWHYGACPQDVCLEVPCGECCYDPVNVVVVQLGLTCSYGAGLSVCLIPRSLTTAAPCDNSQCSQIESLQNMCSTGHKALLDAQITI